VTDFAVNSEGVFELGSTGTTSVERADEPHGKDGGAARPQRRASG